MSYVPDEQLLSDSLDQADIALRDVCERFLARLRDPGRWSEDHKDELCKLFADTQALQLRFLRLKGETR